MHISHNSGEGSTVGGGSHARPVSSVTSNIIGRYLKISRVYSRYRRAMGL